MTAPDPQAPAPRKGTRLSRFQLFGILYGNTKSQSERGDEIWAAIEQDRAAGEAAMRVMREALDRIATMYAHKPECGPSLDGQLFGCSEWCPVDIARRALAEADRILREGK